MSQASEKSISKGLFQFAIGIVGIWFMIVYVCPMLLANIPPLARYAQVAKDNDIVPSMLYYTDVPVSVDAENNNRNTVRFMPKKEQNKE